MKLQNVTTTNANESPTTTTDDGWGEKDQDMLEQYLELCGDGFPW